MIIVCNRKNEYLNIAEMGDLLNAFQKIWDIMEPEKPATVKDFTDFLIKNGWAREE